MRKITALLAAVFALVSGISSAQTAKRAPVRVETGLVQGVIENGLTVYRGIPFAAPPVGERRWRMGQRCTTCSAIMTSQPWRGLPLTKSLGRWSLLLG